MANLLLHGVLLGVSSRGVGSLKNQGGKNMVQDDFELICFDTVSNPSSKGSYVMKDKAESKIYTESIEKQNLIIDDLDKFLL